MVKQTGLQPKEPVKLALHSGIRRRGLVLPLKVPDIYELGLRVGSRLIFGIVGQLEGSKVLLFCLKKEVVLRSFRGWDIAPRRRWEWEPRETVRHEHGPILGRKVRGVTSLRWLGLEGVVHPRWGEGKREATGGRRMEL